MTKDGVMTFFVLGVFIIFCVKCDPAAATCDHSPGLKEQLESLVNTVNNADPNLTQHTTDIQKERRDWLLSDRRSMERRNGDSVPQKARLP